MINNNTDSKEFKSDEQEPARVAPETPNESTGIYVRGFLKITDQPKDLAWWSPILEVQLHFIQVFLYCTNLISKPQKWN